MDTPNEYEIAIEAYAESVRRVHAADAALEKARGEERVARGYRQTLWHRISAYVAEGKITPGIYRLRGPGPYADAVLIERHHDYPELFPMFR